MRKNWIFIFMSRFLKTTHFSAWRILSIQKTSANQTTPFKVRWHIVFLILIILAGTVSSQVGGSFSQSVTYQPRASFQAIYGPEDRLNSYWPILGDKESCQARQDLLLQISPIGCQPAVVRSDLLAEQNVPVFCQIDALQINPLVDIDKIK